MPDPGGDLVLGVHSPGSAWSGGVPGQGRGLVPGGAWTMGSGGAWSGRGSGPRGSGSGGVPGPGGCVVTHPKTATAAGGTHPIGMYSCFFNILQFSTIFHPHFAWQ